MKYTKLGKTGLDVSKIALGCMSYGDPNRGRHKWTLNEQESLPFYKKALELGINFFDTANEYQGGSSEEILGKAIRQYANRDEVVIATKVYANMRQGQNALGLSRKTIMTEVEHSLRRLGTDYIDLYQIHSGDKNTPLEETMSVLNDLIRAGKVRYIGACNLYCWELQKANYIAEKNNWEKFVTSQNYYNLIHREEERELIPFCTDAGIGILPWSPLARGILSREWQEKSNRSENDTFGKILNSNLSNESDQKVIENIGVIASNKGISRAQVAIAWLLHKSQITAPIIGATKEHHLTDAASATEISLSDEEINLLEFSYEPHRSTGLVLG